MTDIINDDEDATNAVTKIFALFGNDILNKKSLVQSLMTDAKDIIKKKDITEKELSNLIEIFNLVIEFPIGRINKDMEINQFLNAKTPNEMARALEMEIALEKTEKGSSEELMKKSIIKATNIKKKILNYLSKQKKFKSDESRLLYLVNNINRHVINFNLSLSNIKIRMYQNELSRNEIIRLLKMEKTNRENEKNYKIIIDLFKKELERIKDETDKKKRKEKIGTLKALIGMIGEGKKREINTEAFNIIKGSSGIVDASPSSGKSIFEEKECVEIAEYADQFCVKFTGEKCDTKSNEVAAGGRKRKSRIKRKKSRKYLRRKRRRESRKKELKRIRKSKKKMV